MPQIQQPQQRLQLRAARFPKGAEILVADDPKSEFFYIIQSGFVYVNMNTESSANTNKKGPGDFIGVISCMSHRSQVEKAIALTDVIAIAVHRTQYMDLIKLSTPTALKIIRTFSKNTKEMNELLMLQTTNKKVSENKALIYQVAKYYDDDGQDYIAAYAFENFIKLNIQSPALEYAKRRYAELKNKMKVYPNPAESLRTYPRGTMVFSEYQSGAEMYVIQSGSVKITKVLNGTEVTLAVLKQGEMFGEMALLENKPRSASAISHDACRLMVVNRENFDQMVATQPQMISRLTTMLADRLWSMYRQLANTSLEHPKEKMIDMLALQIEKQKITVAKGVPYQTDLTPEDIVNLCGITQHDKAQAISELYNDPNVKLVGGKVKIPDVTELIKQAAFYRKQNTKREK